MVLFIFDVLTMLMQTFDVKVDWSTGYGVSFCNLSSPIGSIGTCVLCKRDTVLV